MPKTILPGSVDQSITLQLLSADGTTYVPAGAVTAIPGISIWFRRSDSPVVRPLLFALSSPAEDHLDGGVIHLSNGRIRFDLSDAAVSEGAAELLVGGSFTGGKVVSRKFELKSGQVVGSLTADALGQLTGG